MRFDGTDWAWPTSKSVSVALRRAAATQTGEHMSDDTRSVRALVVESHQMAEYAAFVRATADALSSGMTKVDRHIEGLLDSWRGPAATAYREGWNDFHSGAVAVAGALVRMGDLLNEAGVAYSDTDQANARPHSSLNL
ncbi:WXG100 family type VII secretion target [Rhodococcoides yunnanense]|uniref:WXG100 family type VII secretion target n=2 Tax=Rhodococcoides TaxID=3259750 RepID=A0ABU4BHY5_9NOCA|nr:WXG100 family type VII secretion target [Rhodococcus yunnanensis]MDV6263826.1 WXG100 family type VII secretion target [Rhodococcus yunnanensis]